MSCMRVIQCLVRWCAGVLVDAGCFQVDLIVKCGMVCGGDNRWSSAVRRCQRSPVRLVKVVCGSVDLE